MKRLKGVISILLCSLLILQSACGKTGKLPNVTDNGNSGEASPAGSIDETEPEEEMQDGALVLHSDWLTSAGEVAQTWEKDYTSAEWEDSICLTMYVHYPRSDNDWIDIVEEELNHRLYIAGYDFYIHFEQPNSEEYYDMAMTTDELIAQRRQSGMAVDMYTNYDYQGAIEDGILLELSDYLQSDEGSNLYAHFDPSVWRQLETEDGKIYGIPMNPIATSRYVYAYSPQLVDALGIDMAVFGGELSELEAEFSAMLEQKIAPIVLDCQEDFLLLSMLGMEKYGEIFAVSHTEDDWEAVDLFEEEEAVSFYEQLGNWKEKGFLFYSPSFINRLGSVAPLEMSGSQFEYRFLCLVDIDRISWIYDVNMAADGFVETAFYVPQRQAFITENREYGTYVISADTQYPQECRQFLNLLSTDEKIRMLLYQGIENCHYMWQGDVEVFDGYGNAFAGYALGMAYDLRFWPAGHWGEKYATEIEELNQNVSDGISLTVDCDFAGLEEQYEACRQLFEDNILVFLGYYGAETGERLQALHEQLNEAGYQELIAAVNAMHE